MLNFKLPRTEEYSDKILSLPVYPELTSNHLEKIVELINAFK